MTKKGLIIGLLVLVLGGTACSKQSPIEDDPKKPMVESTDISEKKDSTGSENNKGKTTTEDAYTKDNQGIVESNEPIKPEEDVLVNESDAKVMTDIEKMKNIKEFIKTFYYNNLFTKEPMGEQGDVTEDMMLAFAISHIMQVDHEELKFDADTFRLYIPEKNVEDTISKYFGKIFDNHHPIDKYKVTYEEGIYTTEGDLETWPTRLDLLKALKMGDFTYKAYFSGFNTETNEVDHQVVVVVEERDGRFILTNYRMVTDKSKFIVDNPIELGDAIKNEHEED